MTTSIGFQIVNLKEYIYVTLINRTAGVISIFDLEALLTKFVSIFVYASFYVNQTTYALSQQQQHLTDNVQPLSRYDGC
jgi:hypothetical protein